MAVKAVYVELLEEQMCPCQKRKLEQALDNAKAEIATLNTQIETLNATVVEKDNRITELENQVANSEQPNENQVTNPEQPNEKSEGETTQLPDERVFIHVDLADLPGNLRQGRAFERTATLNASSGSPGHFYSFKFAILNDPQYFNYSLESVENSNDFQDLAMTPEGVITGKIRGNSGNHSLNVIGTPLQSGEDIHTTISGWSLSYTTNLASGVQSNEHGTEMEDEITIAPES
ncbi:hypothetical protein A6B43_00260 [Vespertiliibacter pulmonis]|uniref:Uncharacterized protein n=1 Tax=Vespertiliibacter pulmonis TaxID=1443036 RepID=A0A3N4WLN3_9PAST|nr:hypothetical protein [Vespertiliibacter pulmonis]QLB20079.1 hypothetical protein A6B43_00260 [Vespertiliibacter pulmonis]RPE86044.1 hypothetical protein EDC46_0435 [Vespertiliibacter pulmonis]